MEKKTKKRWLIAIITFLVIAIGFLSDSLNLIEVIKKYLYEREINVGILNTLNTEEYKQSLELSFIDPANKRLADYNLNYKFKLVDVDYEGMYDDLESGKIDLAFSSPYTFLAYKNKKISKNNELKIKAIRRQINSGLVYYSYLIFNSNTNLKPINDSTIIDLYKDNIIKVYIGNQWSSTSTSVIPRIYFWEKGIILESSIKSRNEIIDEICKAKSVECIIGFISSSDYNSLNEELKNKIDYYKIRVKIPSDPVLINENKFFSKFNKPNLAACIISAISSTSNTSKSENWDFEKFEKYVASGVVYSINTNEIKIIFPSNLNDLYNLIPMIENEQLKKVKFIRFSSSTSDPYFFDLDYGIIGSGKIIDKISNDCFIVKSPNIEKIKIGDHVLIEN